MNTQTQYAACFLAEAYASVLFQVIPRDVLFNAKEERITVITEDTSFDIEHMILEYGTPNGDPRSAEGCFWVLLGKGICTWKPLFDNGWRHGSAIIWENIPS